MTYWINGSKTDTLSAGDRAVQFGDGCFTTLKVERQQIVMLEQHLTRLRTDTTRLRLPPPDWQQLRAHLVNIAEQQSETMVLKVIISRGQGGRGYSSANFTAPTVIVSVSPYPHHYPCWQQAGIELILSPIPLGKNPYLAGIKHLNRLEQVLIKQYIDDQQADEALVVDIEGLLVECCSANIFWRQGEQVYTPLLDNAGVNGLMRQRIIQLLADSPYTLQQVAESPQALALCDEVLVCNTLMPIIPVNAIRLPESSTVWHYQSRHLFNYLLSSCQ